MAYDMILSGESLCWDVCGRIVGCEPLFVMQPISGAHDVSMFVVDW